MLLRNFYPNAVVFVARTIFLTKIPQCSFPFQLPSTMDARSSKLSSRATSINIARPCRIFSWLSLPLDGEWASSPDYPLEALRSVATAGVKTYHTSHLQLSRSPTQPNYKVKYLRINRALQSILLCKQQFYHNKYIDYYNFFTGKPAHTIYGGVTMQ